MHFPDFHGFAAFQYFCFISCLFSQFSDVSRRAYCVFKGASQWHVQNRRLLPVQDFCRSMYTIDQRLVRDCYLQLSQMPTSRFESCLPVFSNKAISNCALETFHTLVTLLFPYPNRSSPFRSGRLSVRGFLLPRSSV